MLSATRSWKQKRSREISSREPSVTESDASEPLAISHGERAQSSTSIGLTRVAAQANTSAHGPWM